jgi:hypothetical protein
LGKSALFLIILLSNTPGYSPGVEGRGRRITSLRSDQAKLGRTSIIKKKKMKEKWG